MFQISDVAAVTSHEISDGVLWMLMAIMLAHKAIDVARYLGLMPDKEERRTTTTRKVGNISVESLKAIIRSEVAEQQKLLLHELVEIRMGIVQMVTILKERKD